MRYKIVGLLFWFVLFFQQCAFSQFRNNFGLQVALKLRLGTHINNIGIGFNAYWLTPYFQANLGSTFSLYANGLGPKGSFIENRAHAGLILLAGKNEQGTNQFFSPFFHQSNHNFALGYTYLYYWDNRKTTQFSGAFYAQVYQFSLLFENDLFGGFGRDRFRTAKITVYWKDSLNLAKMNINLWTGETRGADKISNTGYPSKAGYKNLSKMLYGKSSNGILSFGYRRALMFQQSLGIDIGVDAEQIRHFFQNKLTHDLLTSRKNKNNPHYPMLMENGMPYLFLKGQKVRKAHLFLELGIGEN